MLPFTADNRDYTLALKFLICVMSMNCLFFCRFTIYFTTANGDYALKIRVLIDQLAVVRMYHVASTWHWNGSDSLSPFPFEMAKKFTMDIVSTATEFQVSFGNIPEIFI